MQFEIVHPASALAVASILFYDRKETNPFFTHSARQILAGIFKSLIMTREASIAALNTEFQRLLTAEDLTPEEVEKRELLRKGYMTEEDSRKIFQRSFVDVCRILRDPDAVLDVLEKHGETKFVIKRFNNPETGITSSRRLPLTWTVTKSSRPSGTRCPRSGASADRSGWRRSRLEASSCYRRTLKLRRRLTP